MKRLLSLHPLLSLLLLVVAASFAMTPEARRSFEAFERKAEAGDPEALYRLSAILERGYDTIPADTARSLAMLRRSADAGFAPACNYLGYLYQMGEVLPANRDSAIYWLNVAADKGDALAAHNLAFLTENDTLAIRYLERGVEAGLPQSMTILAERLQEGRGVAPDTLRAVELYDRAINLGFRDAELRLLNLMGPKWRMLSSEKAVDMAIDYWNKGAYMIASELLLQVGPAEAETPRAYALLGYAYSRGLGVPYDHHKANEYFARAALLGDPSAQFILSETLEIFPDLLPTLLPDLLPDLYPNQKQDSITGSPVGSTPGSTPGIITLNPNNIDATTLRQSAASAGITNPTAATARLLTK